MKTKLTTLEYLGFTVTDKRLSHAMLPWILMEIKRLGVRDRLSIVIEDGYLKAYNVNFEPVFVHNTKNIIRSSQVPNIPEEFFYLHRDENLLQIYLFRANSDSEDFEMNARKMQNYSSVSDASALTKKQRVTELFNQMHESSSSSPQGSNTSLSNVTRNLGFQSSSAEHVPWAAQSVSLPRNCQLSTMPEATPQALQKTTSNASTLTSLSADLSPSDSHFFEVLYIGKVKVSHRKIPDTLIDDALTKFIQYEADKVRQNQMRRNSLLSAAASTPSPTRDPETFASLRDKFSHRNLSSSEDISKKISFSSLSTTPIEGNKKFDFKTSPENTPKTPDNPDSNEIDDEFDSFSKERLDKTPVKVIKKPTHIALEPNVLILNLPNKNNLSTLTEDESEKVPDDLGSIISDTASSITQFCKENFLKDQSPASRCTNDRNNTKQHNVRESSHENSEDEQTENDKKNRKRKVTVIENKQYERSESTENTDCKISERTETNDTKKFQEEKSTKDDLNHITFEEIQRKPKLEKSKSGMDIFESKKNTLPENKPFLRDRSASIGTLNLKTPITQLIGEQNRTMLFQVGRSELRLISPDRKQVLQQKQFKDIASCVVGKRERDHFGFVCREASTSDAYVCYVFKCESDEVACEVINAIKQAFNAHAELIQKSKERSPNMTCEHCPMLWYHRLCHDAEGLNDKRTHAFILRRIEQLPEDEQEQIITKYQGGTNHIYDVAEHNAFLMMLLRAHCEAKQQRHVHDTAENRSEFLNQYLGTSTIFMKAKRSLSSGFDQLLKRKSTSDLHSSMNTPKKESSPMPSQESYNEAGNTNLLSPDSRCKSMSPAIISVNGSSASDVPLSPAAISESEVKQEEDKASNSPMMDIFMKVGDSSGSQELGEVDSDKNSTWRQAIFKRVVVPSDNTPEDVSQKTLLNLQRTPEVQGKKTKEQLRDLWKLAINQTILLVRMEKENARLRENEESSAVRRIKLEYTELGACDASVSLVWDSLLSGRDNTNRVAKVDHHMLTQAVRQGVPRVSRGGVWYFLAEQACLRSPPPDAKKFPHYHTPYSSLLGGLTKHQHAILIDLGRTFPQHSYFSSALGPGQLALYNILKAYSLLDPDVGYCQGLSFVAGVLLLHMEEAEAFVLLRHLMFRRGLRKQYLPDMSALQVQLYQLSRLLRDHEPELHRRLEALEIAPALYAAPWMLTLFTSQFPLGFVVRVFDLIFLESLDVVFAVSLALLSVHKEGLMLCESCEEAAEYLKHKLPDVNKSFYDKVMKKVFSLDISRQLSEYAVEYAVLREEMPKVTFLTETNKTLTSENKKLVHDLDAAMESISKYQGTQSKMETQMKNLEQQISLLARHILSRDKTKDLPPEVKKVCQSYNKRVGFGTTISNLSSKFSSNDLIDDRQDENERNNGKSILKTGLSAPNLFSKLTKDEVLNMANRNERKSPEIDKKKLFTMKKSQSVNAGLILKKAPLKSIEENANERYKKSESFRHDSNLNESLKELGRKQSGFFSQTHEQIRQERLFAEKLKQDFDENLKKLDEKLTPKKPYVDDVELFNNKNKSISLNIYRRVEENNNSMIDDKIHTSTDSGFVTPMSPTEKSIDESSKRSDSSSMISHPLSDCDVEIKFDGCSTKLKCK